MCDGGDLDRHFGQIDAVVGQAVNHRAEGGAQISLRNMLERQPCPAVGRAAPGLHLLEDGVGSGITGDHVFAVLHRAVVLGEFLALAVQKNTAQFVAERIPHDRIHADQARGQMADGKELHELHINQRRAGAQGQGKAVAAHVGGSGIALIQARQAARGDHRGTGGNRDPFPAFQMHGNGAQGPAVADHQIRHHQVRDTADAIILTHLVAQGAGAGRAGIEEIHINTALAVMARRMGLSDVVAGTRASGPTDPPAVHLPDPGRGRLAEDFRQGLIHQAAAGGNSIGQMMAPMVRFLLANGHRHGHLRHNGGAGPPHHAFIQQQHT